MIDLEVQILVERAINSQSKLHILLMFYQNPRMEITATALAQRCCRDIWSVKCAMQELAEDGILLISRSLGGEPAYHYAPRAEYFDVIGNLMYCYNDPLKRDELFELIHDISDYTPHHTNFDRMPL